MCLPHSHIKNDGKMFFQIYVLKKKIQHNIHKKIFNPFSTKLNFVFLPVQFELNSTQINLNSIEWNSIQGACNVIQYFHSNEI
jgi:hypothetical protein